MRKSTARLRKMSRGATTVFAWPQAMAFVPALMLAGFWFGNETFLVVAAAVFPLLVLLGNSIEANASGTPRDTLTELATRDGMIDWLDRELRDSSSPGCSTITFALHLDGLTGISDQFGATAAEDVLRRLANRIVGAVRPDDLVGRLSENEFGLTLQPVRRANLDVGLQIAERLQTAVAEPVSVQGTTHYVNASVGFCLQNRAPGLDAEALMQAACTALNAARQCDATAIRAYSPEMQSQTQHDVAPEHQADFDTEQIELRFQPQVACGSGAVSGVEVTATWLHPDLGTLSGETVSDAARASGCIQDLSEATLSKTLAALRSWDRSGANVPAISIGLQYEVLQDPRLADRVKWELDRFELTPDRLSIEIPDIVPKLCNDAMVVGNLGTLAALGCGIDLAGFGAVQASIKSIRRLAISRIKVGPSLVTRSETDLEQRQCLAAILSMARELDLETIALGVDSAGTQSMISRLGCSHMQGPFVAHPMKLDDIPEWIRARRSDPLCAVGAQEHPPA